MTRRPILFSPRSKGPWVLCSLGATLGPVRGAEYDARDGELVGVSDGVEDGPVLGGEDTVELGSCDVV